METLHVTATTTADGVVEREFTLGDIPGVLWSPAGVSEPGPLVLMGHGGSLHKKHPAQAGRARHLVAACAATVVAIDAPGHGDRPRTAEDVRSRAELQQAWATGAAIGPIVARYGADLAERAVPEWRRTIDALQRLPEIGTTTPIAYGGGITLGTGIGVPLLAVEPRIAAAILGGGFAAHDALLAAARRVTVPVLFLLQWDDEHLDRSSGLSLFDALGSREKTLHANPGGHAEVPAFEHDAGVEFLRRHLGR